MAFGAARQEGFPTHYPDQHTAAHTDVFYSGLICAIVILAVSLLILLPAFSGWKKKLKIVIRLFVTFFIGSLIILGNYGHNWESGSAQISSPYKAATAEEMQGKLAIHVSLRGINITLTGKAIDENGPLSRETINYNEHFSWEWAQGRFGFGYYAGRISRDFRDALLRGTPWPILQLAEYFTFDGEGLRFGRYYRWAGWYCHLLMWTAFPTWLIALILFRTVVQKGAIMMTLTGLLQLIAIIVWTTLRNKLDVKVPYESYDQQGEVVLATKYGSDYYLVLVNSLLCIIGGVVIFVLNIFYPERLCHLFDIDIQTLYTDVVVTAEELKDEINTKSSMKNKSAIPQLRIIVDRAVEAAENNNNEGADHDQVFTIRKRVSKFPFERPSEVQKNNQNLMRLKYRLGYDDTNSNQVGISDLDNVSNV